MKKKKLLCLLSAFCITASNMLPAFAAEGIEGEEDVTLDFDTPATSTYSKNAASNGNLIVTIDPGHGGNDSGATAKYNGKTINEKDLNLKIAQACKDELEKYEGVTVYMTRSTDTYVALSDRVQYAADKHSNLIVSMHNDASDSSSANGTLMLIPIKSTHRPNLLTEVKKSATQIHNNLVALGLKDRGYLQREGSTKYPDGSTADYYSILRNGTKANIPSMIVENAMLTSKHDYTNYLSSDAKLKSLGIADAQSIVKAYNLKEKGSESSAADLGDAPFTDVYENDWYYNPVIWGYNTNVIQGVTSSTFAPKSTCTRAQAAQMIYNYVDKPDTDDMEMPFTDVPSDAWYADAVNWAFNVGVTSGTSETTFSPNDTCTRAQIVQMLWKLAGVPAVDDTSNFTDVSSDAWYADAVNWAAKNHITSGTSSTTFSPNSACTRAEIITFVYNVSAYFYMNET